PGNSILAIDTITTLTPAAESATNAIDGDASTKFLSFGQDGSGVIVTPSGGPSVAVAMQLTTANDFFERDPISFEIYGTNDAILSSENSEGTSENWTLITADDITLPLDRMTESALITWANTTEYTSYKIIFTELVDQSGAFPADSFQIAEIQLFDAVPEPGSLALVGLGGLALLRRRR
ncbi:MAG: PEP-CTERM sorting domain-containing protein, partial [Phycisphaerales bacterium JB063]